MWRLFFSDTYMGLSLIALLIAIGSFVLTSFQEDRSTMRFFFVASLALVPIVILLTIWRINWYRKIFTEGTYIIARVTENRANSNEKWKDSHADVSRSSKPMYLLSVLTTVFGGPSSEDYTPSFLKYSYNFNGQEYYQRLPYNAGKATPQRLRLGIFRALGVKPPPNITLWMLNLKPGDPIEVVINPKQPEHAYMVRLFADSSPGRL